MIRMAAPYTGIVHHVDESRMAARLAAGYRPIDPVPEAEPPDEREERPDLPPRPTADSTIAEIKAWAKAAGMDLPRKANKAEMLDAIGGA